MGADEADIAAPVGDEPAPRREAQLPGEEGVVADLGMGIQREVIRIERAGPADESGHARVGRAGQGLGGIPVHAVVHDQEIDSGRDRAAKGDDARIHRGADPGHPAVVGHLQPVAGAGRIDELGAARPLVRSR